MSESMTKNVVNKFYLKLIKKLPLEDKVFFGMLFENGLLPLGSGGIIEELKTRHEKASYLLDKIVLPSPKGHLPKLLKVMKECDDFGVQDLADDIEAKLTGKNIIVYSNLNYNYACSYNHDTATKFVRFNDMQLASENYSNINYNNYYGAMCITFAASTLSYSYIFTSD